MSLRVRTICAGAAGPRRGFRITSYNVCYTKLLRVGCQRIRAAAGGDRETRGIEDDVGSTICQTVLNTSDAGTILEAGGIEGLAADAAGVEGVDQRFDWCGLGTLHHRAIEGEGSA